MGSFISVLILLPVLVVLIMIIYRLFKSKQTNNIKMTILSILVVIIPVTPLAAMATIPSIAALGELQLHIVLFYLSGPLGLIALLRSLLGHASKANFGMLLYGGCGYTFLLLFALYAIFSEGTVTDTIMGKLGLKDTLLNIIIFIYGLLSATIFPWHLWITNKALRNPAVSS